MIDLNRKQDPAFHQINTIEFLNVTKIHLDNGIEVNYINGGSQQILKIDFIFNAGTYFQKKPLIASSTINLIKEGTKSYSAAEIAEGIDEYGAFFEVENSYDTATLTLYTLSKYLNNVLPYVKEVLLFPTFSKNEFNIYKNNRLEKFKINLEKVSFVARTVFMEILFGKNHPYGANPTIETYDNLALSDITDFYNDFYNLDNCKILVAGKVEEQTIASLNNFFGSLSILKTTTSKKPTIILSDENSTRYIEKENALQSAIRIGRIIPNKLHPDYFGLQVLNTVLGGYFGSRLMKNIREDKGYTYGIGSGITSFKNAGYFFISTEVSSKVTPAALIEIYNEIELLRTKKIPLNELELVKNYMLGQLLKACDGPFNMAAMFGNVDMYGLDYSYYTNFISTIKKITPQTLLELGVKYLNKSDLKEVVVGLL
ncbi:MAG: insulinase family protein [Flavobacteriales bacterium CG_4_9_14_3_um_filter_32_8]|nr:MAG: insulinase family protein [Flavobacteriales bacterium CG_4_9_14_3_um_filter_32_8]